MTALAPRLTAEMVPLLERGAATRYGRICFPFEVQKLGFTLMAMQKAGFLWWDGYTPMITDLGRAAVNGRSNADLLADEFAEASDQ